MKFRLYLAAFVLGIGGVVQSFRDEPIAGTIAVIAMFAFLYLGDKEKQ